MRKNNDARKESHDTFCSAIVVNKDNILLSKEVLKNENVRQTDKYYRGKRKIEPSTPTDRR